MRREVRFLLRTLPVICLFASGALFSLLFPTIQEMQGAVEQGIEGVPFLVWVIAGGMTGWAFSLVRKKWPQGAKRSLKRAGLAFAAWLLGAVLISLITGDGDALYRLKEGRLIWAWTIAAWGLLCMSPTFLGVNGIMTSSRLAKGGSIIAFMGLGISCMVFSQAHSAEVLHQDPFLSLAFLLSLVGYVEGMNWSDRYGGALSMDPHIGTLWTRQIVFTAAFLAVGASLALLPYLLDPLPLPFYEAGAHLGKAVFGALLIIPLVLFVLLRRYMDRR